MKSLLQKVGTMFTSSDAAATPSPTIKINLPMMPSPHVLDGSLGTGFLAGQLLVATPMIDSGCFQKSVIYVFAHSAEGAMGVVINQPMEMLNYAALVDGLAMSAEAKSKQIPVYFGGPVEHARGFVLHTNDYMKDTALFRSGDLAITASNTILQDLVAGCGPRHAALVVGYAGWTAGQLEAEIEQNSWITVPATADLVFNTENELKWASASRSLGFDMAFFSTAVGHA